jgi:hypothetical protein
VSGEERTQLDDLWYFDLVERKWYLVSGESGKPNADPASHGNTQGIYPTNQEVYYYYEDGDTDSKAASAEILASAAPGARYLSSFWQTTVNAADSTGGDSDSESNAAANYGRFYLFGGWGWDALGQYGLLDDVWYFDGLTRQWVWAAGSRLVNVQAKGKHAKLGDVGGAHHAHHAGGRSSAMSWLVNEGANDGQGGGGGEAQDGYYYSSRTKRGEGMAVVSGGWGYCRDHSGDAVIEPSTCHDSWEYKRWPHDSNPRPTPAPPPHTKEQDGNTCAVDEDCISGECVDTHLTRETAVELSHRLLLSSCTSTLCTSCTSYYLAEGCPVDGDFTHAADCLEECGMCLVTETNYYMADGSEDENGDIAVDPNGSCTAKVGADTAKVGADTAKVGADTAERPTGASDENADGSTTTAPADGGTIAVSDGGATDSAGTHDGSTPPSSEPGPAETTPAEEVIWTQAAPPVHSAEPVQVLRVCAAAFTQDVNAAGAAAAAVADDATTPQSGWGRGQSTGVWALASMTVLAAIVLVLALVVRMGMGGGRALAKPPKTNTQMVAQSVDFTVNQRDLAQAESARSPRGGAITQHDEGEVFDDYHTNGAGFHDMEHGQGGWQAGGGGGGGGEAGGYPLMPSTYEYSSSSQTHVNHVDADYPHLGPLHTSLDTDALYYAQEAQAQEGIAIGEAERRHSL